MNARHSAWNKKQRKLVDKSSLCARFCADFTVTRTPSTSKPTPIGMFVGETACSVGICRPRSIISRAVRVKPPRPAITPTRKMPTAAGDLSGTVLPRKADERQTAIKFRSAADRILRVSFELAEARRRGARKRASRHKVIYEDPSRLSRIHTIARTIRYINRLAEQPP